ncbi:carbohydrate ABC transporter permease [Herbiconiux sp. CPCC 205763]|uniref:Carbohydrate ABC transporter permease n=1 Tax=Herbiconiux aconitum TaxID=2970913 RepID=A0ABT2GLB0_9MICO|nr:carbohydrate ABC transporter permease [Herbiconiux aconitum]MCS5716916.1 carbohydrate ABC transporter permease [Herbiconiux aconitum]
MSQSGIRTSKVSPGALTLWLAGRTWLWLWLVISMVPIVFMLITSIKPTALANDIPPAWIFTPTLENYAAVLLPGAGNSEGFANLLLNSAIVSLGSTALALILAVPAAYALSMRSFRARKGLSNWILSTYMFPPIVAVVPIFLIVGRLGLMDTYIALIIPYAAFNLPIVVWILRSSIIQLPYELQEAAMVDGASSWTILTRVIWPLLVPSAATAAVLTIVLTWNEFLFALTLTRSGAKTAPVGLQQFTGLYGTDWGNITAAATLTAAPILVLMVLLRRQMVSGLAFGAIK